MMVCVSCLIGTLFLCASFTLPNEKIENNAAISAEMLSTEGEYPKIINQLLFTELDNFTDAIIIANSSYNSDSAIIKKALKAERSETIYGKPLDSLYDYFINNNDKTVSYERYWHGYIIFIRPLLMLGNIMLIRILFAIIHLTLLFTLLYLLKQKTNIQVVISFIIPYICGTLYMSPFSLQYSPIMAIVLLSGIIILKHNDYLIKKDCYPFLFLIVGILCSYLDFLTYPLLTLTMDLVFHFLLNKDQTKISNLIIFTICWFIGYGGMWASKWIISSIILNEDIIKNAITAIAVRTSDTGQGFSLNIFNVTKQNICFICLQKFNIILLIFTLLFKFIDKKKITIPNKNTVVSLLYVFILPFIWYAFTKNHSYIHAFFTYKCLVSSIFAILLLFDLSYNY